MKTIKADLVVVGGGPAGMAAALGAKEAGLEDVLIVERNFFLGGILNQCIHNGFGLHRFKEELTGPEYAARYIEEVEKAKIPYRLDTTVLEITDNKEIICMNKEEGVFVVQAQAIVLAMGCRERPRGAIATPGTRAAGIYSAGMAQKLMNIDGYMPGKEVVILGSGDIGLIMARRMTLEGAKVQCVAEIMPHSSGLKRNIVQCLDDYDIPLKLSTTVIDIKGKERVESVVLAQVDENFKTIPGTEEEVSCDTLLLSIGLIPENELSQGIGVGINQKTNGAFVSDSLMTSVDGVFSCGNVLHVHDVVDYVSEEAKRAGEMAAKYVKEGISKDQNEIKVLADEGVSYVVPNVLQEETMPEEYTLRFRVQEAGQGKSVVLTLDGQEIYRRKKRFVAPAEMEHLVVKREGIDFSQAKELKVQVI